MSQEQQAEFLTRVPLFHGIEPALVHSLTGIITIRQFPTGSFLCHKDEPGNACFIIGKGQVNVLTQSKDGEKLCTLGPGHVIGEVALLDGQARSASLQAKDDVTAFVLMREDFSRLLTVQNHACMRLLDNIVQAIAMRVRVVNDQYIDVFSKPGETIRKLTEQMRAIQSTAAGADQPSGNTEELLKKFGYISEGVPSSR